VVLGFWATGCEVVILASQGLQDAGQQERWSSRRPGPPGGLWGQQGPGEAEVPRVRDGPAGRFWCRSIGRRV